MHHPDHAQNDDGADDTFGMGIGFRLFEDGGEMFWAEAEIVPYVDDPAALGVTLVFHPVAEIDPLAEDEDAEWSAWLMDYDDELERDEKAPVPQQFTAIVRQLSRIDDDTLRAYLAEAREHADEDGE
jgi:hypothetical protein